MKKRFILGLLGILILGLLLGGCGTPAIEDPEPPENPVQESGPGSDQSAVQGTGQREAGGTPSTASSDSSYLTMPQDGRKMVYEGALTMETLDYDQSLASLYTLIEDCGGYIQTSKTQGGGKNSDGTAALRSGSYTVRIPSANFSQFMNATSTVATVLSSSYQGEDVSEKYYDTEARLTVLRTKETWLLSMMEQGKDLDTLLTLEKELSDTQYEIESLTSTLRKYDGRIAYATIEVRLEETLEPVPPAPVEPEPDPTTWQRAVAQFKRSWSGVVSFFTGLFVFIVGNSPVLAILGAIAALAICLFMRYRKRHPSRPWPPPRPEDEKFD